jgi:hypothetical protein
MPCSAPVFESSVWHHRYSPDEKIGRPRDSSIRLRLRGHRARHLRRFLGRGCSLGLRRDSAGPGGRPLKLGLHRLRYRALAHCPDSRCRTWNRTGSPRTPGALWNLHGSETFIPTSHARRWQARKGMLSETSNGEARFAPVAIVPATDAMRPIASEARSAPVIEVVLRNGRILRLSERVTPENAARVADALEAGGR